MDLLLARWSVGCSLQTEKPDWVCRALFFPGEYIESSLLVYPEGIIMKDIVLPRTVLFRYSDRCFYNEIIIDKAGGACRCLPLCQ